MDSMKAKDRCAPLSLGHPINPLPPAHGQAGQQSTQSSVGRDPQGRGGPTGALGKRRLRQTARGSPEAAGTQRTPSPPRRGAGGWQGGPGKGGKEPRRRSRAERHWESTFRAAGEILEQTRCEVLVLDLGSLRPLPPAPSGKPLWAQLGLFSWGWRPALNSSKDTNSQGPAQLGERQVTGEAGGVLDGSLALEPKRRPPQGAQRPREPARPGRTCWRNLTWGSVPEFAAAGHEGEPHQPLPPSRRRPE